MVHSTQDPKTNSMHTLCLPCAVIGLPPCLASTWQGTQYHWARHGMHIHHRSGINGHVRAAAVAPTLQRGHLHKMDLVHGYIHHLHRVHSRTQRTIQNWGGKHSSNGSQHTKECQAMKQLTTTQAHKQTPVRPRSPLDPNGNEKTHNPLDKKMMGTLLGEDQTWKTPLWTWGQTREGNTSPLILYI